MLEPKIEISIPNIKESKNQEKVLEGLFNYKKLKKIEKKYQELFPNEKNKHLKSLNRIIRGALTSEITLTEHFDTLEELVTKITTESREDDSDNKIEIQEYTTLLSSITELLILLNDLDFDIPSHKRGGIVSMQEAGIRLPIRAAKMISHFLLKRKQQSEKRKNTIETTIDEYIALKTLETVQKKLISVEAFFTGISPDLENKIKEISEKEMFEFITEVLKKPFDHIKELGLDLEENHPKKIIEKYNNKDEKILEIISKEEITLLEDEIYKHEVVASLLNMEFSYWRRYSLLNLETIKAAKDKNMSELKSVTFTEKQAVPGIFDNKKIKNIETINKIFTQAFQDTCMYEANTWSAKKGILGKKLNKAGIYNLFTSFNRGTTQAGKSELESAGVPRNAFAILKQTNNQLDFNISIETLGTSIQKYGPRGEKSYKKYHEIMLELWIKYKGDSKKVEEIWHDEHKEDFPKAPEFQKILSKVYTLPCVVLSNKVHDTTMLRDLQQELAKITDPLRSNILTSSLVVTFGIDKAGNLAVDARTDHTNWDGLHSAKYIKYITIKILAATKKYQHEKQKPLTQYGENKNIDPNKIIKSAAHNNEEKGNNTQIQSFIKSEGLLRISDNIGRLVRKMIKDGTLRNTKLKNPAIIMQLVFIHHYRHIMKDMKKDQNIGMLMGNSDISVDLDLAPISRGFDLKLFIALDEKGKEEYIKNLAVTLEISLQNTNMELVKDVVENIPDTKIQHRLNKLSQEKFLLGGLKEISGEYMISHFGLPRIDAEGNILIESLDGYQHIHSAGPAKTGFQKNAITIVGSTMIDEEFYLSVNYKDDDDDVAIKEAQDFKKVIEGYNQFYKEKWDNLS